MPSWSAKPSCALRIPGRPYASFFRDARSLDFRTLVTDALEHREQDRPADAERNIRAALGMNPRDDQLLHLLGVALVRQSREQEAIEPLSAATPPSALERARRLGLVAGQDRPARCRRAHLVDAL
jgi:hypothetical protein